MTPAAPSSAATAPIWMTAGCARRKRPSTPAGPEIPPDAERRDGESPQAPPTGRRGKVASPSEGAKPTRTKKGRHEASDSLRPARRGTRRARARRCAWKPNRPTASSFWGICSTTGRATTCPRATRPKKRSAVLNGWSARAVAVRGNCDAEVDQMVLDFPCLADYAPRRGRRAHALPHARPPAGEDPRRPAGPAAEKRLPLRPHAREDA